jgi:GAF domain-containing protein
MIATKTFVHVPDLAAELGYAARDPWIVDGVELAGVRTLLIVPMLKQNELVGAFIIYRQEIRPFTDKQIELLKNFAAQAVIAIENARLLNELRQRTSDLTESLEQQTATSEVLQVISRSLGDLEPVFVSMLEKSVRICDATFGNIYRWDGEFLTLVAAHNTRLPSRRRDVCRVVPIRTTSLDACSRRTQLFTSSMLNNCPRKAIESTIPQLSLVVCARVLPSQC